MSGENAGGSRWSPLCEGKSLVFSKSDCPSIASEVEVPKPRAKRNSQLMLGWTVQDESPVNPNRKKLLTRFLLAQPMRVGQKAVRVLMRIAIVNAFLRRFFRRFFPRAVANRRHRTQQVQTSQNWPKLTVTRVLIFQATGCTWQCRQYDCVKKEGR
jgi:hypothetical protein